MKETTLWQDSDARAGGGKKKTSGWSHTIFDLMCLRSSGEVWVEVSLFLVLNFFLYINIV